MLAWTIYISFIGVAALMFMPRENPRPARIVALLTALAGFVCGLAGIVQGHPGETHTIARVAWVPTLGIEYHLTADGISLVLVLLTGLAAIAGVLFSWNIESRTKEFFAFYLALIGGVYGVFLSADLFLLFVFYELAIIPKYFLIAIWGSTRKEYGAMKLALYSFVGSAMVLVVLIAAYIVSGAGTFDLGKLAGFSFPRSFQMWAFPVAFIGFAILAGLWPFHTWAPTGHVAAPTAASMLLAGVVMKLGAYGCLRVAMTLFHNGMDPWDSTFLGLSSWREVFSLLAIIGIVYGAMVALVQRDFKFVIGYSSVSHMGFVLLGLMTLNVMGLSGAVLQMFSHGVIAGLLFAIVGRMVYDRTHTRDLAQLQPMNLARALPFAAVTFTLAAAASMGLPGFSGFVAELQVLVGAWQAFPTLAIVAGFGILVGVAYTLRALQKAFFPEAGQASDVPSHDSEQASGVLSQGGSVAETRGQDARAPRALHLSPVSIPERLGAVLLIGASLVIGLYPHCLLRFIVPACSTIAGCAPNIATR